MPCPQHLRTAGVAVLAIALAGCGTTGSVSTSGLSGAQKDIASTISNFQSDAETNDTSKLCNNDLASSVAQSLSAGGHTCASVLASQLKVVDSYNLSLVDHDITVKGNAATAVVQDTASGKTTHEDTLTLVKQGSTWRVSGIGG